MVSSTTRESTISLKSPQRSAIFYPGIGEEGISDVVLDLRRNG